jgi:hypothetical protein
MRMRGLRTAAGMLSWIMALSLAGCRTAQQPAPAEEKTVGETADVSDEVREAADASLGKQSEILAQGNLARNGREQVLVVNRLSGGARANSGGKSPAAIFVTRAAVLEKDGGKWSQVLLCDEHLKNPSGYLGGSPAARVNGWRLEFGRDSNEGLEMKFTPGASGSEGEKPGRTIVVRWNARTKRYQSLDASEEKYLNELPTLETPQSILK